MTALVISGIATVATRLAMATRTIEIHRARYGSRYGSSRRRSEPGRVRAGGGAIAGADRKPRFDDSSTTCSIFPLRATDNRPQLCLFGQPFEVQQLAAVVKGSEYALAAMRCRLDFGCR